ncbi:MAG: L-lactate permease [Bryobacteraceae bacterium]
MWEHNYTPLAGSLGLSALVAAVPIFTLLYLLGIRRLPAWKAALSGLGAAIAVAWVVYGMPLPRLVSAIGLGAAFGLLPIGYVVFTAILLYRVTVETGKFEIVKDSIGSLTDDRRLQALLIAFAFGAFIEGASGFSTPVAVSAAMLAGLGFSPFYAASICLLANTAPVAYGAIGTPVVTLAAVTGLPLGSLSAAVGRICAPISFWVPAYLIMVMGGWRALRSVLPAVFVCGAAFSVTQLLVSNYLGPQLTDILSALAAIGALMLLLMVWRPKEGFTLDGGLAVHTAPKRHPRAEILKAWMPYAVLVVFVLIWGLCKTPLNSVTVTFNWPGLDGQIQQMPPVVPAPAPYRASYRFEWLGAAGTACLLASLVSALLLGMSPKRFGKVLAATGRQLFLTEVTIAAVLALAYLMNYCGATATMGLALAATGAVFPFFSAILGWLGVFLTGSDTSANALFGNLQVVTANRLGMSPVLMAAANSSGGVMGKMISLQSIAIAAAATGMASSEESKLFRFTLRHSIILACAIGLLVVFYAYVAPGLVP